MDRESNSEVDLKKTNCEEEAKVVHRHTAEKVENVRDQRFAVAVVRRRTAPPPPVIAGAREEKAVFGDCCDGFTTDDAIWGMVVAVDGDAVIHRGCGGGWWRRRYNPPLSAKRQWITFRGTAMETEITAMDYV
ncbi:hypothetical protein L1987_53067 [Smallanthus sonchifolius]|uniref:Uncharacterized protein n=1 Tax=Smallanthus sonchifolius TaxID=185202 RepID=A0ACB9EUZ8_9ASTR|nr:hypothetical protein L1987_53067 [Smallanthus sonchifolius]